MIKYIPLGGGPIFTPPVIHPTGNKTPKGSPTQISPGLYTSVGGLTGALGALIVPIQNTITNRFYVEKRDPTNFNCEENAIYYFRQENIKTTYAVTNHKLIVIYRNIGLVTVTFNLTVFRRGVTQVSGNKVTIQQGTYKTVSKTLTLGTNNPDKKLYTIDFNIANSGERPQVWFYVNANAGPLSIISVLLIGNADEKEKGA